MSLIVRILFYFALVKYSHGKRPNVLFIVVDDLRPALGAYNDLNSYTPNIDKLAQNSFIFTNTFAQQALCAPSRNSFLTSRRPDTLHLYDFYSYWRDTVGNFTTIPQHFRENDYVTHSIGKVFHVGESSNNNDDAPYSWSLPPFHPKTNDYKDAPVCLTRTGERKSNLLCPVLVEDQPLGTLPDLEILQNAQEFLKKYNKNENGKCLNTREGKNECMNEKLNNENGKKPYFLAVGFHKPHIPFKFPREYLKFHLLSDVQLPPNHYRPALLPTVAWAHWADVRQRDDIAALNISLPYGPMDENTMRQITQHYNAAVTYVDDMIGGVLNSALGTDWAEKDTIVVLTADHGWSLGEHGELAKYSNFEVATKVPLIIYVPGLTDGESIYVNDLTELVDLFPTLVDLTRVSESLKTCPIDQNAVLCTEGQSLVPLMVSHIIDSKKLKYKIITKRKTAAFSQYPRYSTYPTLKPNNDKPRLKNINIMGYSIRTTNYRYTEWVSFDHETFQPNWNKTFGRELYDHSIDPGENLNLSDRNEMQDIVKKLRKQVKQGWRHAC